MTSRLARADCELDSWPRPAVTTGGFTTTGGRRTTGAGGTTAGAGAGGPMTGMTVGTLGTTGTGATTGPAGAAGVPGGVAEPGMVVLGLVPPGVVLPGVAAPGVVPPAGGVATAGGGGKTRTGEPGRVVAGARRTAPAGVAATMTRTSPGACSPSVNVLGGASRSGVKLSSATPVSVSEETAASATAGRAPRAPAERARRPIVVSDLTPPPPASSRRPNVWLSSHSAATVCNLAMTNSNSVDIVCRVDREGNRH